MGQWRDLHTLVTSVIGELSGKFHVPASSPSGKSPAAIEYEPACVPHSVCVALETKIFFAAAENRTTIPLVFQPTSCSISRPHDAG